MTAMQMDSRRKRRIAPLCGSSVSVLLVARVADILPQGGNPMNKPDFSNFVLMSCTNPTCFFEGAVEKVPEQSSGEKFVKSVGMFLVGAIVIGFLYASVSVLLMLVAIGFLLIWLTPIAALIGGIGTVVVYLGGVNCPVCKSDSLEYVDAKIEE